MGQELAPHLKIAPWKIMHPNVGARLGPYEILSLIGSGGMGDVYRARDSRLGRIVAVKILPQAYANDPERRSRFEREARAISSLAHPHICTLHDVGHDSGLDYFVMEYLEGESLDARLKRGPIPLDEMLRYAIQIASALHEAHRHGVVHRDLKPANVMITRNGARLLDFGLVRLRPDEAPALGTVNETQTVLTAQHTFVGTLPYMAPEQLLGREADARSDIFSFGIMLFELISGRRPFEGDTGAGIIAGIVEKETPRLASIATVPAALDRLVQHCLLKDPERRWQNARDLELELTWIREHAPEASVTAPPSQRRRLITMVLAAALLAAGAVAGVLGARRLQPGAAMPAVVQFAVLLPETEAIHEHNSSSLAFSRDGTRLVYAATRQDGRGLYVRSLAAASPTWIAVDERAASPFFSHDGQWIAFESAGTLKKIPVDGGTPLPLCETPYFAGGAWGEDDMLVLVPSFTGGLFRLNARGGRLERLTKPEAAQGERGHIWPQMLPDGRVLFTIWTGGNVDESKIAILNRGGDKYRIVFEGGFHARYSSGRLVLARANRLLAVPFDIEREVVTGPPQQLVDGVAGDAGSAVAGFAVDSSGSLAYAPGSQHAILRTIVTLDASGKQLATLASGRAFNSVRVSPDGEKLLFWIEDVSASVHVKHFSRDPLTRLAFSGDDHGPVWSPDGRFVAFESGRASIHQVFVHAADGSGEDRQVTTGEHHHYLNAWGTSGLAYVEFHPETGADLWIVNADGPPRPRVLRATRFSEKHAAFSPNGRWVAYVSNESGMNEVYVIQTSGSGERTQISSGGGEEPAWSRAGDRLFYRSGARMMSMEVGTTGDTFKAGQGRLLFERLYHYTLNPSRTYDVGPDGRFYMVTAADPAAAPRQLNVMLHALR